MPVNNVLYRRRIISPTCSYIELSTGSQAYIIAVRGLALAHLKDESHCIVSRYIILCELESKNELQRIGTVVLKKSYVVLHSRAVIVSRVAAGLSSQFDVRHLVREQRLHEGSVFHS